MQEETPARQTEKPAKREPIHKVYEQILNECFLSVSLSLRCVCDEAQVYTST